MICPQIKRAPAKFKTSEMIQWYCVPDLQVKYTVSYTQSQNTTPGQGREQREEHGGEENTVTLGHTSACTQTCADPTLGTPAPNVLFNDYPNGKPGKKIKAYMFIKDQSNGSLAGSVCTTYTWIILWPSELSICTETSAWVSHCRSSMPRGSLQLKQLIILIVIF